MFDLRANSNNDRKNRAKINYKNWKDIVSYPEHKNKSKDLIDEKELLNNLNFIDKTVSFQKEVEAFTRDQRWHNKNRTKNIKRSQKTDAQMEEWLLDKQVATNYTVQENNIFFQKKFGGDKNKIVDFYKKSLDSILESTGIDKERIIYATIHFDQSNPHLHFSISNIHSRLNKEHKKMLHNVNSKAYNPVNVLKEKQNQEQAWIYRNKLSVGEKSKFNTREFRTEFKTKYAERLSFHKPIIDALNKKYNSKIYANTKDHISMRKIRGYDRDATSEKMNSLEWHNLKNSMIFAFRKTKLRKELESSERLNKGDSKTLLIKRMKFMNQFKTLEDKYNDTKDNIDKTLKPNIPEQNMLNKKKYFLRKDVDLFMHFGKDAFKNKTNDIYKNRMYNKLLYLCNERELTPQALLKEVYTGKYIPEKYSDATLNSLQKAILQVPKITIGKAISTDKKQLLAIKNRIEKNISESISDISLFMKVKGDNFTDKSLDPKEVKGVESSLLKHDIKLEDSVESLKEKSDEGVVQKIQNAKEEVKVENNRLKSIGIEANFIKVAEFNHEIKRNEEVQNLSKVCKVDVTRTKSFNQLAIKSLGKTMISKGGGIKALGRSFSKRGILDELSASVSKELKDINRIREAVERKIAAEEYER